MKLGRNNLTGVDRHLSSWTTSDNPSVGNYTFELDPTGFPQLVGKRDSVQIYCSGPWNGVRFSGAPNLKPNPYYSYEFVFNQEEVYYAYYLKDSEVKTRLVLSLNGDVQRFLWNDRNQEWILYLKIQIDMCDNFASCGAYGSCKVDNQPQCMCLPKFEPRVPSEWNGADWSQGCVRKTSLDCENGDGFARYSNIKLPDTKSSWYDKSMDLEECKMVCLRNCSCVAYARLDLSTRSGCLLWFGDLIDLRDYPDDGQEIYVRLASSEIKLHADSSKKKRVMYILSFVLAIGLLALGGCVLFYCRKKKKEKMKREREEMLEHIEQSQEEGSVLNDSNKGEDLDLPLFDHHEIVNATNSFSVENKLGEGGFGPVYKGILKDGQMVAVKKLSLSSRQGDDEFKNEVVCIAKLQHRNLVKLLGCCIHVEKMLIYEYMPNKSLDFIIFGMYF
jgi:hypothetical protein